MKITLIGATGFVGSAILKEALNRQHEVSAILRDPRKLTLQNTNLSLLHGDIMDAGKLAELLKGTDVVISAYNPGWNHPDIYNAYITGAQSIQEAVKKSEIKRLIVIGGAGSLFITPKLQLIDSPKFPADFKAGASAARDYLNILQKEDQLEWTYLSPAIEMNAGNPGRRTGIYRTGMDNPVVDNNNRSIISVEDLAVAIVDEAEHAKHIRQRFTVAY